MQVKCTHISDIGTLFQVWFIQYYILFRVRFRKVSLYMVYVIKVLNDILVLNYGKKCLNKNRLISSILLCLY